MANVPVNPQPVPGGPHMMYQNWSRLLFLHWTWDVAKVQATLPRGLTVDTWDDRAWLGIVPFRMEGVRPRFCPAVPGLSNFPELNVRTYVRDKKGRTGVWFYSLDCTQPLAIWAARTFFGLPYFRASMSEQVGPDGIAYRCRRRGSGTVACYEYAPSGNARRAGQGTREEFLVERYRLFAVRRGQLLTAQVWHEPYELEQVEVSMWSGGPLSQAGFDVGETPPEHATFCTGVKTCIFGVEPA